MGSVVVKNRSEIIRKSGHVVQPSWVEGGWLLLVFLDSLFETLSCIDIIPPFAKEMPTINFLHERPIRVLSRSLTLTSHSLIYGSIEIRYLPLKKLLSLIYARI